MHRAMWSHPWSVGGWGDRNCLCCLSTVLLVVLQEGRCWDEVVGGRQKQVVELLVLHHFAQLPKQSLCALHLGCCSVISAAACAAAALPAWVTDQGWALLCTRKGLGCCVVCRLSLSLGVRQ